jgi:hypothetical protein
MLQLRGLVLLHSSRAQSFWLRTVPDRCWCQHFAVLDMDETLVFCYTSAARLPMAALRSGQ